MPTTVALMDHLPLVHQVVARFMGKLPPNVLRDDLVAAGTYGLIDALRKNGEDRGPTFEWYARIRIRGAILDELRSQDWLTRRARSRVATSNCSGGHGSATIPLEELPGVAVATEPSPFELASDHLRNVALKDAVASLPERERRIITRHYSEDVQLKTIAQELGVSEPRVSQLHARAVGMLREKMAEAT